MARLIDYIKRIRKENDELKKELVEVNQAKGKAEELADASMESLERMGVDLDDEE